MSKLEISVGKPRENGRYVCYLPGVDVPTVIRFWLNDRWLDNLQQPVKGDVNGWIGPLPVKKSWDEVFSDKEKVAGGYRDKKTEDEFANEGRCPACGEYVLDRNNCGCPESLDPGLQDYDL